MHSPTRSASVAPTVRSFSAEFEPLRLIAQYPVTYPGLLESSTYAHNLSAAGRFDILPISTQECLRLTTDGQVEGPHASPEGFLRSLAKWTHTLRTQSSATPLPFTGGWLLYLGYELAMEIEPRLRLPVGPDGVVALAIRAPAAWIRDRSGGGAWLVAEPGYDGLLDDFEAHVRECGAVGDVGSGLGDLRVREEDPQRFLAAVSRALDSIAAGDIYQANLSRQWRVTSNRPLDPVSVYARLRSANPSPFAALMRHGDFALMSSSPERLVSIRAGIVSTRPIAGTRPRGVSEDTDAALRESLLNNDKERAEHVMLIDLERNDLGRVCVGGTESYAHVHHIVSNVSGQLREECSSVDVIRALFPGGTITGVPKVRCMEIIGELEGTGRGAYTGSLGYLNRDGSCDLNILIRTLSTEGEAMTFRAGAGIVADSVPMQELAETRVKAKGLLRALGVDEDR